MDSLNFIAVIGIVMRFLHVLSAVVLVGGAFSLYQGASEESIARWRLLVYSCISGLLISGLYNFLHKPGFPSGYHAVFGIKMLLALHVFAVAIIASKPNNPKRSRQLTGVAYSGIVIVLLSAILRWLSQV